MSNLKVMIKSIELHYFKGIRSLAMEFGPEVTEISGPNGCGKSTVADAFTWCLFGKNMKGESDTKFLVKTVDANGVEIPHVNHEVKLVLEVNGAQMELKRILVPEYDKDDNLNGNHTEYYYNEVPLKKSEYDQKVKAIMDEDVFKLITSPFAFLQIEWKKQRELLMNMVGDVNDEMVAAGNADFTGLLDKLTGKTLNEYRKELACKLGRVNDEMVAIPVRIDELKRNMPEGATAADLQRKAEIEDELTHIEAAEKSLAAAADEASKEYMQKTMALNQLKQKRFLVLQDAETVERMKIHEANSKYNEAEAKYKALQLDETSDAEEVRLNEIRMQQNIQAQRDNIKANTQQMDMLRNKWKDINAQEFDESPELKCPLYGHACQDGAACSQYEANQHGAYAAFCAKKDEQLAKITEQGKSIRAINTQTEALVADLEKKLETMLQDREARKAARIVEMAQLDYWMKENPKAPLIASVKGEDLPEYVELTEQIKAEEEKLTKPETAEPTAEQMQHKFELKKELDSIKAKIASGEIAKANGSRIKELEEQLKTLGAEKAMLENERRIADDFEIAKMNEVSNKVNSMFELVSWQMFTRQVNGELVPACIALINGVRWDCANTASMYNAGIDVATSLGAAYGVSAPMFIDNAESIGTIYNPGRGQQIHLRHVKELSDIICNF